MGGIDVGALSTPAKAPGNRVAFPLIRSEVPGTLVVTKETIDEVECEDDLRRSGSFGYV